MILIIVPVSVISECFTPPPPPPPPPPPHTLHLFTCFIFMCFGCKNWEGLKEVKDMSRIRNPDMFYVCTVIFHHQLFKLREIVIGHIHVFMVFKMVVHIMRGYYKASSLFDLKVYRRLPVLSSGSGRECSQKALIVLSGTNTPNTASPQMMK